VRELRGGELLDLPVRLHGIQLGRPVDLLLERESFRAVGLDVACGDEVNRFLPLLTAVVDDETIAISSPLLLFDRDQLTFYHSRSVALSTLLGGTVQRGRRPIGVLRDVVIASDGTLAAVVVEHDGRTEKVPFDESVAIVPASRSAA
jgi:hypothetical protein